MRNNGILFILGIILLGCGTTKIESIRSEKKVAYITLTDESNYELKSEVLSNESSDTLTVIGLNGERLNLMRAVKDSLGDLYATENLSGVKITAKFKNIAERGGMVDIAFDIHIPKELQDLSWQLRFEPTLYILQDTIDLDDVYITGSEYKAALLRGYQQYEKYLSSIITDSSKLRFVELIEVFIERNIPELYRLKRDSSLVSDDVMRGFYDISYKEVLDYYSKRVKIGRNNLRAKRAPKMFDRYLKNRISNTSIRIDSIITSTEDIKYCYTQSIETRPMLRKVDVTIGGSIMKDGKKLYVMEEGDPLTFYISSISSFAEDRVRYITSIVERKAQANTQAYIDFRQGEAIIDPSLHENRYELSRIGENIISFINDEVYEIDSLVITASSSPEGSFAHNTLLSWKRGNAIKEHFIRYAKEYEDSLAAEAANTYTIDLSKGGDGDESYRIEQMERHRGRRFNIQVKTIPENWELLKEIIKQDTIMVEKDMVLSIIDKEIDLDEKELMLQNTKDYLYLREKIYPRLRGVKFDFYLCRKGMIKDTIHTTTIDTVYRNGLRALKERDYPQAVELLRPYHDINSAVAYLCMDYNASALSILEGLPDSPKREYMKAIVYARNGEERKAIQSYIYSVEKDQNMKFRANLDPEISHLIKKYSIKLDEDIEY